MTLGRGAPEVAPKGADAEPLKGAEEVLCGVLIEAIVLCFEAGAKRGVALRLWVGDASWSRS